MEIKFLIGKQIDKEVAKTFFELKRGGIDFNNEIKQVLPGLKNKKEIEQLILDDDVSKKAVFILTY